MAIDTRPPLNLSPDHTPDVSDLRYDCRPYGDFIGPKCGKGQRITIAYEQERSRMTGTPWYLVNRCASCGSIINGSAMQSSLVTKEQS